VIADGTVSVVAGEHAAPSFTVSMSVETWRAMQKREIQPQAAFFQGLVKIQGDYGAAMRLMPLFR
jgi:putative sterol carrier protein